ncbi:MAG: response regulator [Parvibaculum sp.]
MKETNLTPLRILIVDDSLSMRELLQALLEAMGITDVIHAKNGEEGLQRFYETRPDIIITDGAMGPMDGYELTDRIRTNPDNPNPYVPIIMLSGYLGTKQIEKARAKGVTEYLGKPVSSITLYERIIEIIGNPYYFIRTPTYLGPDRRRETGDLHRGAERRTSDAIAATGRAATGRAATGRAATEGKVRSDLSGNAFNVFRSYE